MTTKIITWKVIIDENKLASMEAVQGLPKDTPETHMLLIGVLENLKQLHLKKLQVEGSKSWSPKEGLKDDDL